MKLVLVEWVDSNGGGGWQSQEAAVREAAADPLTCETVGWLLDDTDRYLLVAPNRTVGRKVGQVGDPMQIPHVAVVAVRELKPGRPVRRAA